MLKSGCQLFFMNNTQCWQLTMHPHRRYLDLMVASWNEQFYSLWFTLWPRDDDEEKVEDEDDII